MQCLRYIVGDFSKKRWSWTPSTHNGLWLYVTKLPPAGLLAYHILLSAINFSLQWMPWRFLPFKLFESCPESWHSLPSNVCFWRPGPSMCAPVKNCFSQLQFNQRLSHHLRLWPTEPWRQVSWNKKQLSEACTLQSASCLQRARSLESCGCKSWK